MTPAEYATHPHLEIERALAQSKLDGAKSATVTLHQAERYATLEDDLGNVRLFNTNIHPSQGHQHITWTSLRNHPAPAGMTVRLKNEMSDGHTWEHDLLKLDEAQDHTEITPTGEFRVTLMPATVQHPATRVKTDGTSAPLTNLQGFLSIRHTKDRNPGTVVNDTYLAIVAHASSAAGDAPELSYHQIADIHATAALIARRLLQETAETNPGYTWPSDTLRNAIRHLPQGLNEDPPGTQEPSISEYRVETPDAPHRVRTAITPGNAVLCDYDSVQADTLQRAVAKHAPTDMVMVRTKDPSVPAIRLVAASVTDNQDRVQEYPVRLWPAEHQSGRYDGRPQPKGAHLPHSRVERVKSIRLTMETIHRHSLETETFTFNTDAYTDQDLNHHLALITNDSELTAHELEELVYFHSPRNMPKGEEETEEYFSNPQTWFEQYSAQSVAEDPQRAAERTLQRAAQAIDLIDMANIQTGTRKTVTALSKSGNVKIILNPPEKAGFNIPEPRPGFLRADPAQTDPLTHLQVPTSESPGAIQPGHILVFSPHDGKLETTQPEDTPLMRRVHPLTVVPAQGPALDRIKTNPEGKWLVISRGYRTMTLAPWPQSPAG